MIDIDIRTALLFNALLYCVMPVVTWFVLAQQRNDQIRLWCVGGLLIGFSLFMYSMRGAAPDWVAPSLATHCTILGVLLRAQSLRIDLNIAWRGYVVGLILALSVLQFELLFRYFEAHRLRAQFASSIATALLLHTAHLAWRISRRDLSTSARWIAGAYACVGLVLAIRVLFIAVSSLTNPTLVQETSSSLLLSLSLVLSAVISHIAYIGMALDRSHHRELKLVEQRGRAEEQRKLSDQIAHLDRQRSLGELSASLGHELNQPLATILTQVQTAKRGIETGYFQGPQVVDLLDKVAHNTRRASQIIDRIRGYIRPSATKSDPVDLHHVISESLELMADEAKRQQVRIVRNPGQTALQVTGDSIQLSQIIVNLLRNAVEAMGTAPKRELHLFCAHEGSAAVVRLRDTGPGLSAEALTQIGAPFFTTKSSGLGMGITISRSIAEHHGGSLSFSNVNAAEGGGLLAELRLPIATSRTP